MLALHIFLPLESWPPHQSWPISPSSLVWLRDAPACALVLAAAAALERQSSTDLARTLLSRAIHLDPSCVHAWTL